MGMCGEIVAGAAWRQTGSNLGGLKNLQIRAIHKKTVKVCYSTWSCNMLDMLPAMKIPHDFDPSIPAPAAPLAWNFLHWPMPEQAPSGVEWLYRPQICNFAVATASNMAGWEILNEIWRVQWKNHLCKIMEISLDIYKLCFIQQAMLDDTGRHCL
jgi:hypothetical protein